MKKIVFLLVALIVLLSISSCEKDGVYKPEEKLSEVWQSSETSITNIYRGDTANIKDSTARFMSEAWQWSNKELTSRTTYKSNGEIQNNYIYEYKDGRIIGITIQQEKKTRIRFIYDPKNDKIKEIRYFTEDFSDNDLPHRLILITYDGKKIVGAKEIINEAKYNRYSVGSILSLLGLPEFSETTNEEQIMPKIEHTKREITYNFGWDEKNITKVDITEQTNGETKVATIEYGYDQKTNVRNNCLMGIIENGDSDFLVFSKNNVTSYRYQTENYSITEQIEYSYDKKVPIEKMVTREIISTRIADMKTIRNITEKWSYVYVE